LGGGCHVITFLPPLRGAGSLLLAGWQAVELGCETKAFIFCGWINRLQIPAILAGGFHCPINLLGIQPNGESMLADMPTLAVFASASLLFGIDVIPSAACLAPDIVFTLRAILEIYLVSIRHNFDGFLQADGFGVPPGFGFCC
jgi:hypothetical protein